MISIRKVVYFLVCAGVVGTFTIRSVEGQDKLIRQVHNKPNILFIAVDDLNDWVGHLGGHPQAKTPNIDRLAGRGVSFSKAYCSAPLCNPSRISFLTGILPSNSGVYGNDEQRREKLPEAVTLMQYLRSHGYSAKGGGKIFHGTGPGDPDSWDYYHRPKPATLCKAVLRVMVTGKHSEFMCTSITMKVGLTKHNNTAGIGQSK